MNGQFVRLYKEDLLEQLLHKVNSTFSVTDYALGIPKRNFNPLTRILGNTFIKLCPRNSVPNTGNINTYYNRSDLQSMVLDKDLSQLVVVEDFVYLYDILDQINRVCNLKMTTDDVYNTTIKEFHDGKFYAVILAKPESYSYIGKVELQIGYKFPVSEANTILLDGVVLSTLEPQSLSLTGVVVNKLPATGLVLHAEIVNKV